MLLVQVEGRPLELASTLKGITSEQAGYALVDRLTEGEKIGAYLWELVLLIDATNPNAPQILHERRDTPSREVRRLPE
jgi:hypothetical protein